MEQDCSIYGAACFNIYQRGSALCGVCIKVHDSASDFRPNSVNSGTGLTSGGDFVFVVFMSQHSANTSRVPASHE